MSEKHPKQDFQVERLAFFSDAVFAIAITLLVIEFKAPTVTAESTYAQVWKEIVEMKFKFFALILSFIFIAGYWMRHHMLFKYIHNYNQKIVVLNLLVLFPVIFFPFTTAFLYESTSNENVMIISYRIFLINHIIASGTMYYFCWLLAYRYKHFLYPIEKKEEQFFSVRLLMIFISFIFVLILSFFSFKLSFIGLFPLALLRLYHRFIKKQKSQDVKQETSSTYR